MSNRRAQADAELEAIYAEVPPMADCRGLCHDSCGPIYMAKRERQRVHIAGVTIPTALQGLQQVAKDPDWRCPALGDDDLCTVYALRPLLCRLYGAVEELRCSHGCVPVGGFLTKQQASELIRRAELAGGRAT